MRMKINLQEDQGPVESSQPSVRVKRLAPSSVISLDRIWRILGGALEGKHVCVRRRAHASMHVCICECVCIVCVLGGVPACVLCDCMCCVTVSTRMCALCECVCM